MTFFGHPWGLSTLFMTEMWERFSYYGMKAILLYYMYYQATSGGLGLDKSLAKSMIAVYGAALYLSSIAGGWVADRIIGSRRSITAGAVLIMGAHIALSIPGGQAPALYVSMVLLVLGTGLLKPNITKNVSDLYEEEDDRRDAGFTLFVMSVQIGSFVAPFVVSDWLAQPDEGNPAGNHFHLGFGAAAIGMAIGLTQYLLRQRHTLGNAGTQVPNPLQGRERTQVLGALGGGAVALAVLLGVLDMIGYLTADGIVNAISVLAIVVPAIYFATMLRSSKVSAHERSKVLVFIPLFISIVIFWFVEEQQSGVMAEYADKQTDLDAWGFRLDPGLSQTINPIMMLLFAPVVATLWTKLRRQPSIPQKLSIGLFLTGLGFAVMMAPALLGGPDAKADPLWVILSLGVIAVGELFVNPVSLSASTRLAPAAFVAQVVGLNYAADAAAQGLIAQVSKAYTPETAIPYFGITGLVVVGAAVVMWFAAPALHRKMTAEA